jgi:hypothetical protein
MAAKLYVLCLYLPVALRLIAFGYRLGPPEASREIGNAVAELGFRLSLFAGAAVLVSMLLFGRRGALRIRHPVIASIAFFGLLVVLDRAMRIPMAQLPFPVTVSQPSVWFRLRMHWSSRCWPWCRRC